MTAIHVSDHEFPTQAVQVSCGEAVLEGDLCIPREATGLVIFAHGSGSSRFSSRNRRVATALNRAGLATLLLDLLTTEEEHFDLMNARLRFDIPLLAGRMVDATEWAGRNRTTQEMSIGYFGASTGAAAALTAAARLPDVVKAVVIRGGRPDLALSALEYVKAPSLFLVGEEDREVLTWNREAMEHLSVAKELIVVPGATHLFEEPGALEQVARHAARWFQHYLSHRLAVAV